MIFKILTLAAGLLWAQTPPPQYANMSVQQLHDAFAESIDPKQGARILDQITMTKPSSPQDVSALFDLFMRYPDNRARAVALRSLQLIGPDDYELTPIVMDYLKQSDPSIQFFAIHAALQLRAPDALPILKKIAEKKFAYKSADETVLAGQRSQWWTQYEALDALAQWEGPESLSLLKKKAAEAPDVARLIAGYFWKQSLPEFVKWANSYKESKKEEARQALMADVPLSALRETRPEMLKLVLDEKQAPETRHWLAIKIGVCSTAAEVTDLLKLYRGAQDPKTKLYLLAALYASRDPQIAPLLIQDLKTNPEATMRQGALVELKELLKPAEYLALAQWVADNDPDPLLKSYAQDQIKAAAQFGVSASTGAASGTAPAAPAH